jgi:hypothetical protein
MAVGSESSWARAVVKSKSGVLRVAVWILAVVIVLVGAGAGLALGFLHKFSPHPPRSDFPRPANALEAQRQDLEQFSRLIAMDRSFSPAARLEATRQVDELKATTVLLGSGTLRVALMRITALADNGHTSLDDERDCVPARVMWFADGLYVLRAKPEYADLLGARVERVDGRPAAEVLTELEKLRGGTNGWRRILAALYIQSPELLYGASLGARPDQTTWALRLPNGSEITRQLPGETCGEPYDLMMRWLAPEKKTDEPQDWRPMVSPNADLPLTLRDFNSPFRRVWIDHGCTLFIQLKTINDTDNLSIRDFFKVTTDEMSRRKPCNIILDLRFNTGGDYTKAAHFAGHLPDFVPPGGRIYVLTSAQTFSAAITTVAFVKQAAGSRAVILGEPVGDRLAFYGEGGSGCLPHAGLCVHYATGMHDYARPCNDWDKCYWLNWLFPVQVSSLDPDETIGWTFAAYSNLHDPAFERAITLAAGGG